MLTSCAPCRGGGGGNFGVITNYVFEKLPPAPQEIMLAHMSFSWADMTEEKFAKILTAFSTYFETRGQEPDAWGLFAVMGLNHKSTGTFGINVHFCNPDGTCKDLRVLNEFLNLFDTCSPDTQTPTQTRATRSANPPQAVCVPNAMTRVEWIDTDGSGQRAYHCRTAGEVQVPPTCERPIHHTRYKCSTNI